MNGPEGKPKEGAIQLEVPDVFKTKRQQDRFSPFTATRACCGLYHSLVIGKRGGIPQLYGWGRNHNNVLALGAEVVERSFPAQLGHFAKCHVFQVACGLNHTVVIIKQQNQTGGKVYSCGLGNQGRLGFTKTASQADNPEMNAWFTPKPTRVRFPNKEKIARIACGSDHTLALTDNGELFAWGVGQYGNLGTGETNDEYFPVRIAIGEKKGGKYSNSTRAYDLAHGETSMSARGGTGFHEPKASSFVIHCSAGGKHSLACTLDGQCYAWGHGGNGRLGLGHSRAVHSPERIEYLDGREIISVAAGEAHSACIDKTGVLYTWGAGGYGRLGHGDDVDVPVPRKVEEFGGVSIIQVACGTFHTMAVSRAGALYGWGAGLGLGLVAEGDNTAVLVPKQVREGGIGSTVCQVAVGTYHTIALTLSGDVFCWGVGGQSRLGHGDNVNQAFPKYVAELRNKAFIDDIKPWLTGQAASAVNIPSPASALANEAWRVQAIGCGDSHTAILTASGDLWVWGSNSHGQLGLGEDQTEPVYEPVLLTEFKDPIKRLACGKNHCLASTIRGDLFVWGDGSQGQLGLGRIVDVYKPAGISNLSGVFFVAAGEDCSACLVVQNVSGDEAAFAKAGDLWTWGNCEAGKLGHEGLSSGSCVAPKKVKLSFPISKVACGRSHMVACSAEGEVFTWGAGYYGRLGIGSSANTLTPVRVKFPDESVIVDVAAGAFHSFALSSWGVLWAWGRDIAVCASDHVKVPMPFEALESTEGVPRCKAVSCCGEHSFAVTQSGQVFAWGDNKQFQLGIGKKSPEIVVRPELLVTLPDAVDVICTGNRHSVVALRGGDVYSWGANESGCLGIGYKKARFIPSPEPVPAQWASLNFNFSAAADHGGAGGAIGPVGSHVEKPGFSSVTASGGPLASGGRAQHVMAYIQHTGDFVHVDDTNAEQRVARFLERLKFPNETIGFSMVQELLKSEPQACTAEELAVLEDDLIKIFGRFLNIILKMQETETNFRLLVSRADTELARFVVNTQCDAPDAAGNERFSAPEFYLSRLSGIQLLVGYLQMQPAHLAYLAASIKNDHERNVLLSATKQLYWNIDDRLTNALFMSLCAAICTREVETAPDLLRLFRPQDSNFIQLFALYACQLSNLAVYGRRVLDPACEGGAGYVLERLGHTTLALTPEKIADFHPESANNPDALQSLFHASLEGIQAVLSTIGPQLTFPLGVCAILKHAYDCIVSRDFLFDAFGGAGGDMQLYSYYPLARLILQGILCRLWKDPKTNGKYLHCSAFTAPNVEINFRTLWVFINSAFEDDFSEYTGSHLFREIFQFVYMRTVELIVQLLSRTPDAHIRVELTLGLYLSHFDLNPHFATMRSDVVAALINLLKDHEAHLQLSAYDPVTEVMKTISGGQNPVFTREMLEILETYPSYHNMYLDRRFLLKEKNAVFDATTGAAVPQRLALRQQAATTRDGRSVISLIHRYVPPDPLDPRTVLQDALRVVPLVTARDWATLQRELMVLQEFFSRQDPPLYEEAQLAAKAAKYVTGFEAQEASVVETLKWMGDGLCRRQRHRAYLLMVQSGEDAVADAQRRYQFDLRKMEERLQEVVQKMGDFYIEPFIRAEMERRSTVPKADRIAAYVHGGPGGVGRGGTYSDSSRLPAITVSIPAAIGARVVERCALPPASAAHTLLIFTAQGDGGWSVQIVESPFSRNGAPGPNSHSLDKFELSAAEMKRLSQAPHSSEVTYGQRLVSFNVSSLLHFLIRGSVQPLKQLA